MASCAADGMRWDGATPDESIDIALTLDALAPSARSGSRVDVAS